MDHGQWAPVAEQSRTYVHYVHSTAEGLAQGASTSKRHYSASVFLSSFVVPALRMCGVRTAYLLNEGLPFICTTPEPPMYTVCRLVQAVLIQDSARLFDACLACHRVCRKNWLSTQGSPLSRVERCEFSEAPTTMQEEDFKGFSISHSRR